MNIESFVKGDQTSRDNRKLSKSKEKKKSVRLGSFFRSKVGDSKKSETIPISAPIDEIASLHPGGSKSPRGLSLRTEENKSKTKRIRGTQSVKLDSKNLNTIQPPSQKISSSKKTILDVPPTPSPRRAQVPYSVESDSFYKLREIEEQIQEYHKELTLPPLSKRVER